MTNKPMLSVERELIEFALGFKCNGHKNRTDQAYDMQTAKDKLRALLDKPVLDVDDEQWYADTPDGDSALVTRVGALTEWQKGRDGMRAERDAVLIELSKLKAAQHKGEPVGCRYRKTDRPDRCWTYCEGVKVTPWKDWEVQPLFTGQPAPVAVSVVMPERKGANHKVWHEWTHEEIGYNRALDDVARLNGVKP